jgi:hypothetical protein
MLDFFFLVLHALGFFSLALRCDAVATQEVNEYISFSFALVVVIGMEDMEIWGDIATMLNSDGHSFYVYNLATRHLSRSA